MRENTVPPTVFPQTDRANKGTTMRRLRFWLSFPAVLLGVVVLIPPLPASSFALQANELQQARAFEEARQWGDAFRLYDRVLSRDRGQNEAREGCRRCLRHLHLLRRHQFDVSYAHLATLNLSQALDLYEEVLTALRVYYAEGDKVDWSSLFQNGLDELHLALDEGAFAKKHLAGVRADQLADLKAALQSWRYRKVGSRAEAREQVQEVADRAAHLLGLKKAFRTIVALEFACGACNGLDEWTVYLTPAQYNEARGASRGKGVGVGADVAVVDQKLVLTRVAANGPAALAGLYENDRVTQINGRPTDGLGADAAAERLRGEPGTWVEVEIVAPGAAPRVVKLQRQAVQAPSVEEAKLLQPEVGYVRVSGFHENTVQELKEAVLQLQSMGMKGLVLDLRGNPGGLFKPAVQVAELFLGNEVIVYTHSQGHPDYKNRALRAESVNPWVFPLVVLVDGETASAAEVVAGALKENRRATLVGQTTFGKGSIQTVIPVPASEDRKKLDKIPPGQRIGLCITVAKFSSPARQPYSGRGVIPDIPEENVDAQLRAALNQIVSMVSMPSNQ